MSQTAIPFEFERYLQSQISAGKGPDMNEMIFAYIPGLDASQPIDRNQGLPPSNQWVHRQDIDQLGKMGDNALAYSVVIPGNQPAFTFNAIFLRDKAVAGSCGFVVHKAQETKELGSALTRTLVMEYNGAAALAGVNVDAGTWQIDFSARLTGMDEDHRLACLDNYGQVGFVSGFDVVQQADPNKYKVTSGVAYIGGLRAVLANDILQTVSTKPNALWLDVYRDGTSLSNWENHVSIIASGSAKSDYVDSQGRFHYVAAIADIAADGSVVDRRQRGGMQEHLAAGDPHPQYILHGAALPVHEFRFEHYYQEGVILLIPYITDGAHAVSECIGRLELKRGSIGKYERLGVIDISAKCSFSKTSYMMTKQLDGWDLTLCTLEYNGLPWLALQCARDIQEADVRFIGHKSISTAGYDPNDQLKVLTYYAYQAGINPTNPEIASTIQPIPDCPVLLDSKNGDYFSENRPPKISEIPSLNDSLNSRVSRSTTIGQVVEFSTDTPRPGFVKAQRIELLRSSYPKLWSIVSSANNLTDQSVIDADPMTYAGYFGTGNGSTTFTTPDYHLGHYRRGAQIGIDFGTTQSDAIRNIEGFATLNGVASRGYLANEAGGALAPAQTSTGQILNNQTATSTYTGNIGLKLDVSKVVPTAEENRPKTINTYIYIYHGEEAA